MMPIMPMKTQIFTMDVEKDIYAAVDFARLLHKHGIVGEFYICGYLVEKYPQKVKEIVKHHILGGHGYYHEDFAKLSNRAAKMLIKKTIAVFRVEGLRIEGWRFPCLSYTNYAMNLVARFGLYDSSISNIVWKDWDRVAFLRNWARNLLRGILTFPYSYSRKLREKPWAVADINDAEFYAKGGRLICHCYNFANYKRQLVQYLK